MEVYGTTLSAYVLKLTYPYGISSILQNEYRLNKSIKERHEKSTKLEIQKMDLA